MDFQLNDTATIKTGGYDVRKSINNQYIKFIDAPLDLDKSTLIDAHHVNRSIDLQGSKSHLRSSSILNAANATINPVTIKPLSNLQNYQSNSRTNIHNNRYSS